MVNERLCDPSDSSLRIEIFPIINFCIQASCQSIYCTKAGLSTYNITCPKYLMTKPTHLPDKRCIFPFCFYCFLEFSIIISYCSFFSALDLFSSILRCFTLVNALTREWPVIFSNMGFTWSYKDFAVSPASRRVVLPG